MFRDKNILSEAAIFAAGALAVGLISSSRRREKAEAPPPSQPGSQPALAEVHRALAELEARVAGQESLTADRFGQLEARIEEHSAKLSELPSTQQIVGAMEQLIAKTMGSLDDRLTSQAHLMETLKTTVSQTDSVLERVLESLDTLNSYGAPGEEDQSTKQAAQQA